MTWGCEVLRGGSKHGHLEQDSGVPVLRGGPAGRRHPTRRVWEHYSGARGARLGAPTLEHSRGLLEMGAGPGSQWMLTLSPTDTLSGTSPVGRSLGRAQAGLRGTGAGRVAAGVDSEAALAFAGQRSIRRLGQERLC